MAVPGIHDSMREFRLEVIPFNNRRDMTPAGIQEVCAKQHPETRHRLDRSPPIMSTWRCFSPKCAHRTCHIQRGIRFCCAHPPLKGSCARLSCVIWHLAGLVCAHFGESCGHAPYTGFCRSIGISSSLFAAIQPEYLLKLLFVCYLLKSFCSRWDRKSEREGTTPPCFGENPSFGEGLIA